MTTILIPVFGMATGILIVGVVLWYHYRVRMLEHKERIIAMEKGLPVPGAEKAAGNGRRPNRLFRGIFLLLSGAGLFIALYVSMGQSASMWGVLVIFVGLGYLAYWFVAERGRVTPERYDEEERIR